MGTLTVNAVPFPVALGSNTQAAFTMEIPAGSVIQSGYWQCSGWDSDAGESQEIFTSPSGSDTLVINGNTVMSAGQLADFNAAAGGLLNGAAKYTYYQPLPQNVYITAVLTGTFPQPSPPGSPVHAGTASSGVINLCQLNIRDMRCMMGLQSIYVAQNVSNLPAPIGVQILRPENVSFLTITPGLINLNGASGNASCSMRVYKEIIGSHMQWISNAQHLTPPMHCQLAAMPVLIPWDGPENVFVEFEFLSSPLPASSSLEFSIAPILMQGRSA